MPAHFADLLLAFSDVRTGPCCGRAFECFLRQFVRTLNGSLEITAVALFFLSRRGAGGTLQVDHFPDQGQ